MNGSARRSWVASECPDAECRRWATAEWVVDAQLLPRQDDECAQLGSLVSRWPTRSEPGTVRAGNEPFGRLSKQRLKGGLELPAAATRGIRISLACFSTNAASARVQTLGCRVVSSLKIMHFLLASDGAG